MLLCWSRACQGVGNGAIHSSRLRIDPHRFSAVQSVCELRVRAEFLCARTFSQLESGRSAEAVPQAPSHAADLSAWWTWRDLDPGQESRSKVCPLGATLRFSIDVPPFRARQSVPTSHRCESASSAHAIATARGRVTSRDLPACNADCRSPERWGQPSRAVRLVRRSSLRGRAAIPNDRARGYDRGA